jgi:hypothetical protein
LNVRKRRRLEHGVQPSFQSSRVQVYADNANSFTNVCGREMGENKLAGKR